MRFADRTDVWNPRTDQTASYPLPAELRDASISVMGLGANQLLTLTCAGYWQHGHLQRIVWLEKDKGAVRTETAELAGYRPPSARIRAWQTVPVVPIPVAWGFVEAVLHPLSLINERRASSFSAALGEAWQECWPAFITVLALSAALAWLAYRRQQKHFGGNAKLWALFVFLAGVPGWITWRIMHPKPPLEPCPLCGATVPRDRTTCGKCAEAFPEPELTGIEVFA